MFLIIAGTRPKGNNLPPLTVINGLGDPDVVVTPDVTSNRRETVLYKQLPGLRPKATGAGDPQMTQLVGHMATMNENARIDREDRQLAREESKKPKTVRENFEEYTTDMLLKLSNQTLDEDIPKVYQCLAK